MLYFNIQIVYSIGDLFVRGLVCLILAVWQIQTSFKLWMFDTRSSSTQGANICFLLGFILEVYKKRKEEDCKFPMILVRFGEFIYVSPSWYITALSCLA